MPHSHFNSYKVPRRPFESARLDAELKVRVFIPFFGGRLTPIHQLAGEYGLRNKRELWRISLILSKIRRAARELLKLDEKDPKRLFEGNALIRRLVRIGVLDENRMRLDYVLALKIEDFLERRLQTQVFKSGLAKSIHHARVLIRQRHIRCVALLQASSGVLTFCEVLASKSSTCPLSLSDLIPKNTSTSRSPPPTAVVAPVVSSASAQLLLPSARRVETTRKRSKLANTYHTHRHIRFLSCSLLLYEHAKVVRPMHHTWSNDPG